MDMMPEENKVLGIPAHKYLKVCYILVLIASGYGLLTNIAGLVGVYLPGGMVTGILGLIGLALAVTGWLVFAEKFRPLDIAHFKFLIIVFVVFFFIYVVLVNALATFGPVGAILITLISVAQFGAIFAGFLTWKKGLNPTIENLKSSMRRLNSKVG